MNSEGATTLAVASVAFVMVPVGKLKRPTSAPFKYTTAASSTFTLITSVPRLDGVRKVVR